MCLSTKLLGMSASRGHATVSLHWDQPPATENCLPLYYMPASQGVGLWPMTGKARVSLAFPVWELWVYPSWCRRPGESVAITLRPGFLCPLPVFSLLYISGEHCHKLIPFLHLPRHHRATREPSKHRDSRVKWSWVLRTPRQLWILLEGERKSAKTRLLSY